MSLGSNARTWALLIMLLGLAVLVMILARQTRDRFESVARRQAATDSVLVDFGIAVTGTDSNTVVLIDVVGDRLDELEDAYLRVARESTRRAIAVRNMRQTLQIRGATLRHLERER